jgi:hypothetical protein
VCQRFIAQTARGANTIRTFATHELRQFVSNGKRSGFFPLVAHSCKRTDDATAPEEGRVE